MTGPSDDGYRGRPDLPLEPDPIGQAILNAGVGAILEGAKGIGTAIVADVALEAAEHLTSPSTHTSHDSDQSGQHGSGHAPGGQPALDPSGASNQAPMNANFSNADGTFESVGSTQSLSTGGDPVPLDASTATNQTPANANFSNADGTESFEPGMSAQQHFSSGAAGPAGGMDVTGASGLHGG